MVELMGIPKNDSMEIGGFDCSWWLTGDRSSGGWQLNRNRGASGVGWDGPIDLSHFIYILHLNFLSNFEISNTETHKQ